MAQLQSTSITGSLIVTGGITGSISASIVAPGSNTQVLYNNGGVIAAASGLVYSGSNVGIGTTSPVAELNVQGTSTEQILVSYNSTKRMLMGRTSDYGWISPYTNGVSYDNLVLVRDGGNVGIGTSSPSTKLQVAGNVYISNNGGNLSFNRLNGANVGAIGWHSDDYFYVAGHPSYGPGAGNDVRVYGFGANLFLGNSTSGDVLTVTNGGNIGIGTTSPAVKFHVVGSSILASNTSINPDTYGGYVIAGAIGTAGGWGLTSAIGGNSGTGHSWAIGSNGDNLYMGYENGSSSNSMQTFLQVDDSTRNVFLVPSSGNVGIGTTSPGAKLDVNGDIFLSETGRVQGRAYPYDTTVGSGADASTAIIEAGSTNGYRSRIALAGGNATDPNTIKFLTTSAERMRITSGGNIGIGTASPYSKLSVFKNGINEGTISFVDANSNAHLMIGGSDALVRLQMGTYNNGSFGAWIQASYDNVVAQGTEPLILNPQGGNVGIGTTSPGEKLDVVGNVKVGGTSNYNSVTINNNSTTGGGGILAQRNGTTNAYFGALGWYQGSSNGGAVIGTDNSSYPIVFYTNTEKMRITGDGNVGIGTSSPSSLFTVAGTSDLTFVDSSNLLRIDRSSNVARLQNYSGGSASTNLALQWEGGNVGIGTSSPTSKLSITDSATMYASQEGTFLDIKRNASNGNDTTSRSGLRLGNNSNAFQIWYGGTTDRLRFIDGGNTEVMSMVNGGNIGIGTTSPGAKLHVVGNQSILSGNGVGSFQVYNYQISTGTSVSDNQTFSLYLGRFGNGYHKIIFWALGYGTDTGNYFEITTDWGGTTAPKILTNGGLSIGAASYTIHYVRVDYGSYDLFIKYTAGMPTGYANTINYDILSNTGAGYTQFTYASGVTVPTLDSNNLVASIATFNYDTGRVGIGVTSPSYKLEVDGNFYASTTGQFGNSYINGTNSGWAVFGSNSTSTGVKIVLDGDVSRNDIVVSTAGYVGIGTASPSYKLHVNGSPYFADTMYNGGGYISWTTGYSDGTTQTYNGNSLAFLTNASSYAARMFINSSGNVGINTTTPTEILDVRGVVRVSRSGVNDSGILAFGNYLNGVGYYDNGIFRSALNAPTTSGNILHISSYEGLAFTTSPHAFGSQAIRMYIDGSSGNVGIGTTSPSSLLSVAGNATFGQGANRPVTYDSNGGNFRITPNSGGWATGYFFNGSAGTYKGGFGGYGGGDTLTYFWIGDDYNTPTMVIQGSQGNVGIGTTSPGTRLDVRYDDGISSGEHNVLASFSRNGNGPLVLGYRANGSSVTSALIRIGDGLPLTIGTTSTNQAFILLDNGNVGIGNTSPNGALSFADDVKTRKIVLWDGAANNDYQFYGFGVESSTMIQSIYDSGDRFLWVAGTGTGTRNELMVIQGTGNVGIGTTSPTQLLHILGTNAANNGISIQNTNSSGNSQVRFLNTSGTERAAITYVNSADAVYHYTSAGGNLFNLVGANVGIGTTSPSNKFELSNAGSTSPYFYVDGGNTAGTQVLFEHTGTNTPVPFSLRKSGYSGSSLDFGILYIDMAHNVAGGGSNLHFTLRNSSSNLKEYGGLGASIVSNTAGAESGRLNFYTTNGGTDRNVRMVISPSGNVGIGTTSPGYKLDVDGAIGAASAKFLWNGGNALSVGSTAIGSTNAPDLMDGVTSIISNFNYEEFVVQGDIITGESSGTSLTKGQLVYFRKNTGLWEPANASAATSSTMLLGIVLNNAGAANQEIDILLRGIYQTEKHDSVGAKGVPLWVSNATAGNVTDAQPSNSGDTVRGIGWCLGVSGTFITVKFEPDVSWVTV
jgi:hypothetical protein